MNGLLSLNLRPANLPPALLSPTHWHLPSARHPLGHSRPLNATQGTAPELQQTPAAWALGLPPEPSWPSHPTLATPPLHSEGCNLRVLLLGSADASAIASEVFFTGYHIRTGLADS